MNYQNTVDSMMSGLSTSSASQLPLPLQTTQLTLQGENDLYIDPIYHFSITFPSSWSFIINPASSYSYAKQPSETFTLTHAGSTITFYGNYAQDICFVNCTYLPFMTVRGLSGTKIVGTEDLTYYFFTKGENTLTFFASTDTEEVVIDSIIRSLTFIQ